MFTRVSALAIATGMVAVGAVSAQASPAGTGVSRSDPRPTLSPRPIPTPQATITIQTFLSVTARAPRVRIPRTGTVTLVEKVTTDPAQEPTTRTRISVKPKRARSAIKTKTNEDGSITVRTRDARNARVQIVIRADGPDTVPTTWVRTWRVR